MPSVHAAGAPATAAPSHASAFGAWPSVWRQGWKWSLVHTESNPACSASTARSRRRRGRNCSADALYPRTRGGCAVRHDGHSIVAPTRFGSPASRSLASRSTTSPMHAMTPRASGAHRARIARAQAGVVDAAGLIMDRSQLLGERSAQRDRAWARNVRAGVARARGGRIAADDAPRAMRRGRSMPDGQHHRAKQHQGGPANRGRTSRRPVASPESHNAPRRGQQDRRLPQRRDDRERCPAERGQHQPVGGEREEPAGDRPAPVECDRGRREPARADPRPHDRHDPEPNRARRPQDRPRRTRRVPAGRPPCRGRSRWRSSAPVSSAKTAADRSRCAAADG